MLSYSQINHNNHHEQLALEEVKRKGRHGHGAQINHNNHHEQLALEEVKRKGRHGHEDGSAQPALQSAVER